ncbi:uncharacterized protein BJX67DRAFT_382267 [Aspergillus lucknowensis]|uniref:Uncharacterized protein n=1 Tax=Aspergillus lucknowensis TaxID=176173 RepID=A0ABR4LP54_9EURO
MPQFIATWEIKDYDIDDMAVRISTRTARKLGLLQAQFVWVHYNKTRRPFFLRLGEGVEDNTVYMSFTAQSNLSAQAGGHVYLRSATLPTVDSITLYPLAGTATLEGNLVSDYVGPYFSRGIHPVHLNDFIAIGSDLRFCVVAMERNEFGLVTPETQITLVRGFGQDAPDYNSIGDAVECALELRRNIDYITPAWCAESLAEFARGFQRLVDLLQAPPLYEKAISDN